MFSIELKNDLKELERLHKALGVLGEGLCLSKRNLFRINLAMEEIFSNIVCHGFRDNKEHLIKIIISQKDEFLCFRIEDDGIQFNPLNARPPDLKRPIEERPPGGLGCYLMRCCMDEVKYERKGERNILTMRLSINAERPEGDGPC